MRYVATLLPLILGGYYVFVSYDTFKSDCCSFAFGFIYLNVCSSGLLAMGSITANRCWSLYRFLFGGETSCLTPRSRRPARKAARSAELARWAS